MSSQARRLRLVVVDNDPAVLELLVLDLQLEGHDVVATAPDAAGAIEACAQHRPDVVVVDLRMGRGLDGIEVAAQLREAGRRVILHTNYVSAKVVKAAARAGATVVEKGSLVALRRAVIG